MCVQFNLNMIVWGYGDLRIWKSWELGMLECMNFEYLNILVLGDLMD